MDREPLWDKLGQKGQILGLIGQLNRQAISNNVHNYLPNIQRSRQEVDFNDCF